jgi:hypothetical protein
MQYDAYDVLYIAMIGGYTVYSSFEASGFWRTPRPYWCDLWARAAGWA